MCFDTGVSLCKATDNVVMRTYSHTCIYEFGKHLSGKRSATLNSRLKLTRAGAFAKSLGDEVEC
jgi:hypothetical protein